MRTQARSPGVDGTAAALGTGIGRGWRPAALRLISIPPNPMEFPMAKLTLDLDALQVETFEAAPAVPTGMPITVYPTEYRYTCC